MSKYKREQQTMLPFYDISNKYEISIDEAGRGPLFGRLYVGAVILPQNGFENKEIKDSKKFTSKIKMREVAEYIKENCYAWNVSYIEADVIDQINILQSVYKGMHKCIAELLQNGKINTDGLMIIVDGDKFKPYIYFDDEKNELREIPNVTIEKGDSKYIGIASASILAKVEHDKYIEQLCSEYPQLVEKYSLNKNMGYGTKQHIDGIKQFGISQWHRKSFGLCKDAVTNIVY